VGERGGIAGGEWGETWCVCVCVFWARERGVFLARRGVWEEDVERCEWDDDLRDISFADLGCRKMNESH